MLKEHQFAEDCGCASDEPTDLASRLFGSLSPVWRELFSEVALRGAHAVRAGLVSDPEDRPYRGSTHDLMF